MSSIHEKVKCLLIKTNYQVEEIETTHDQLPQLLNTKYTDHEQLTYLDEKGYACVVFCKDIFEDSDEINKIASLICKKANYNGTYIRGDVILIDDEKELTKSDLSNMMKIANSLDYGTWSKKREEKTNEILKQLMREL